MLALLRALCRPELDPASEALCRQRWAALDARDVGWLIESALRLGAAPWVQAHLRTIDVAIPEARRRALEAGVTLAMARSLGAELARRALAPALLAGLDAPALLFKGEAVAAHAYGEDMFRPTTDVDVLVRPGEAARVDRILREAGFRPLPDTSRHHAATWGHEATRAQVDVHARPLDPRRFRGLSSPGAALAIFERARLGTTGLLELELVDHMVTLLVHLLTGGYSDLRHVADAARMLSVGGVPVAALRGRAEQWGARRALEGGIATVSAFDPRLAPSLAPEPAWRHPLAGITRAAARERLRLWPSESPRWLEGIVLLAHLDRPLSWLKAFARL